MSRYAKFFFKAQANPQFSIAVIYMISSFKIDQSPKILALYFSSLRYSWKALHVLLGVISCGHTAL